MRILKYNPMINRWKDKQMESKEQKQCTGMQILKYNPMINRWNDKEINRWKVKSRNVILKVRPCDKQVERLTDGMIKRWKDKQMEGKEQQHQ